MNSSSILVSVVVPMHNAETFISQALRSILREKEVSIEVVVVNDKSTDRSLERVRAIVDDRILVFEGIGQGAPDAMNVGFSNARGSIIMFCDADDLYPPERIKRQTDWLRTHPEYDAICGTYSTIDPRGNTIALMECGNGPIDIADELKGGKLRTSLCTFAMRSAVVKKAGNFRSFFKSSYDIDFQLRLGEVGRIAFVPENFYFYRIHSSSITHTQSSSVREFFERTALELQQQRQSGGLDDIQRGSSPAIPNLDISPAQSASKHIQSQLLGSAWRDHQRGKKSLALRVGIRALLRNPLKVNVWRSVLALAIKPSGRIP